MLGGQDLFEAAEVEENESASSQVDQALSLQLFQGPRYYLSCGSDAGGEFVVG